MAPSTQETRPLMNSCARLNLRADGHANFLSLPEWRPGHPTPPLIPEEELQSRRMYRYSAAITTNRRVIE